MRGNDHSPFTNRCLKAFSHPLFRLIPIIIFILIVLFKLFIYERSLSRSYGYYGSYWYRILHSDGIIIFAVIMLYYFSIVIKSRLASIAISLGATLIVLVYCLDFLLFSIFEMRLDLAEIAHFAFDTNAGFTVLNLFSRSAIILLCLSFILTILIPPLFGIYNKLSKMYSCSIVILAFAFLFPSLLSIEDNFVRSWYFKNIIEINLNTGIDVPYTAEFRRIVSNRINSNPIDTRNYTGNQFRGNIILVVVESLSSYHSKFFSGINNYTPKLDELATRNMSFVRFHANGFGTEHGLIGILTGQWPIAAVGGWDIGGETSFRGFWDLTRTLPKLLKSHGYATIFLTGGELEYFHLGTWMKNIGFDVVEGSEVYDKSLKRYHFDSPLDEFLFGHALLRARQFQSKAPYFMVVNTVNTHFPFMNLKTGERSEKAAFAYIDNVIAAFHKNLENEGFYRSGCLIITSDHRAMTPITKKEMDVLGSTAPAAIPLIVIQGENGPAIKVDKYFQQSDLFSSIEHLVSDEIYLPLSNGILFSTPPVPPFVTAYVSGLNRDRVDLMCGGKPGSVILKGDQSHIIGCQPKHRQQILDLINYQRMRIGDETVPPGGAR